uniref:Uncharacterized protein n=1 Tax=Arion vulgaris TaxID=1028688 RepID=A0A0B7ADN3_9EUPU
MHPPFCPLGVNIIWISLTNNFKSDAYEKLPITKEKIVPIISITEKVRMKPC